MLIIKETPTSSGHAANRGGLFDYFDGNPSVRATVQNLDGIKAAIIKGGP
jgi:hypothetical protein